MELYEIKGELIKTLEDRFNNMSEEDKEKLKGNLDNEENIESYMGSLSNWIDNFDWDGLPRDIYGDDK